MFGQNYSATSGTNALSQTAQFFNAISNSDTSNSNSPANANDSQQEVQFAPSFLFGNQQPSNRRSFATPNRQIAGYGSPSILKNRENVSSAGKSVHWSPVLVREKSKSPDEKFAANRFGQNKATNKTANSALWNGPPLRSLNDVLLGPPEKVSRLEKTDTSSNKGNSHQFNHQQMAESMSDEMGIDVRPDEEDNPYWITIFGFSPGQFQQILELFSRHGDIMAQKTPTKGNWVHIRYSSPVHAQQALAKNATIFQGQMIGVVPCKDREALDDESARQNTTPVLLQQTNRSLNGSSLMDDSSFLLNGSRMIPSTSRSNALPSRARLSISSRAGMRPLNASAISADGDHHNDSSFKQNGTGDDSLMGKLWNMFTNSSANTSGTS